MHQIVICLQCIRLTDTTSIGLETTAVDTLTAVAGIVSRIAIVTPPPREMSIFMKNTVVGK